MATQEDVITTSIDLRRMVDEAMAAGFNPLTVLRSGAAAGFGTQRIQTGVVGGGSFTEQPTHSEPLPPVAPPLADGGGRLASGELYGPAEGNAWDPNVVRGMSRGEAREIFGGSSEPASYSPWEAESEFNMAVHQLRMRNAGTGNVVTDDGVVIRTNHAAQYSQGGMFNPITYTGSTGVVGTPAFGGGKLPAGMSVGNPKVMEQFQSEQVWQTDKLPKVVMGDIYHPLFPGVSWLESGGGTRGETFQTLYGDEGPGGLMSWPKWLYDAGKNQERFLQTFVPKKADDASWWPSIKWSPD